MDAGSLIVPFDRRRRRVRASAPRRRRGHRGHGSIQVLRHVSELGDRFDFVASADEQLIPPLLYDRDDPATGEPWASWYCSFATNRMVLAVSPKSPLAGRAHGRRLVPPARRGDVRFGLADPRFDAAGYRALMVLQLAERDYDDPYLLEDMLMGRFTTPITVEQRDGADIIEVPEILETSAGSQRRAARRQHPARRPAGVRRPRLRLRVRERRPAARARLRAAAGLHRPRRPASPRRVRDRQA